MHALSLKALSAHLSQRAAAAICTFALGVSLITFVGFAPMAAVHNAAHDTRHSAAFPCH